MFSATFIGVSDMGKDISVQEKETPSPTSEGIAPPEETSQTAALNVSLAQPPELEKYSQLDLSMLFGVGVVEAYRRAYVVDFQKRVDVFESLAGISSSVKDQIRPTIRGAIGQVEAYRAWDEVFSHIYVLFLGWLFTYGLLIAVILVPVKVWSRNSSDTSHDVVGGALANPILALGLFVICGLVYALVKVLGLPDWFWSKLQTSVTYKVNSKSGTSVVLLLFGLYLLSAIVSSAASLPEQSQLRVLDWVFMCLTYLFTVGLVFHAIVSAKGRDSVVLIFAILLVSVTVIEVLELNVTTAGSSLFFLIFLCLVFYLIDPRVTGLFAIILLFFIAIVATLLTIGPDPVYFDHLKTPGLWILAGIPAGLMVVAVWFIAAFLLELVLYTLPCRLKRQTRARLYPKEEIIDKICRTIGLATDSSNDWNTYEVKRTVIEQLESLAGCIEVEFFESVAAKDAPTTEWWSKQTTTIAQRIRLLKRAILAGTNHNLDDLVASLQGGLVLAAEGCWDEEKWKEHFPLEDTPLAEPTKRIIRAWQSTGPWLSMLIPILLFMLVLYNPGNHIRVETQTALSVFLATWALAKLVHLVDPEFTNTMKTQDALASILNKDSSKSKS
jgi:hypothetical protein